MSISKDVSINANTEFNLSDLLSPDLIEGCSVAFKEVDYINNGESQTRVISNHNPTVMSGTHSAVTFVTKLNDQRWGVELKVNCNTGMATCEVDLESPIVRLRFQLSK